MCNNHKKTSEYGSRIEHGKAHEEHHKTWSRRQFLTTGALGAAGAFLLNNTSVSALAPNPLVAALNENESERILVLINLAGGNDGLNMVVPYNNNSGNRRTRYEELRNSATRWSTSNLLPLNGFSYGNYNSSDMALPNVMQPLITDFWNNDALSVISNVGYKSSQRSHFSATRIWETASNNNTSDPRWGTGWAGRYLEELMPAFLDAPPSVPPALQIGYNGNIIFNNSNGLGMGLTFKDAEEFYNFALSGELFSTTGLGDCPNDKELAFVRQVANGSFRYAESVKEAYNKAYNDASYITTNNEGLAKPLGIIARLIKGQLGTKVYLVSIGGFDNHQNEMNKHPLLMQEIAESIQAFFQDLKQTGMDENVVAMTYSEFGRTMDNNGNNGTDHGTLAPVLMFGKGLNGGLYGDPIDLNDNNIGATRAPKFENQPNATDFRNIYATLLQDWLCIDGDIVDEIIGKDVDNNTISRISNLIANPCSPGYTRPAALLGHNYSLSNPNIIEIKYSIRKRGNLRLTLGGIELINQFYETGSYTYYFDRTQYTALSAGEHEYILDSGGERYKRRVILYTN